MTDKSLMEVMETQRLDLNEALGLPRQATHVATAQRARVLVDAELMLRVLLKHGVARTLLRDALGAEIAGGVVPALSGMLRRELTKELAA